jgi:hypothetical protein
MSDIADSSVTIRSSAQSIPSPPSWFGEAAVIAHYPYANLLPVLYKNS